MGQRSFWLSITKRVGPSLLLVVLAVVLIIARKGEAFTGYFQVFDAVIILLLAGGIFFLIIAVIVSLLEYNTSSVMMDDSSFHIVRGVLSKQEVSLPYRRIQSVEIKQSIIYRIFGIAHVVISTTTDLEQPTSQKDDESSDEVIQAMDYELARLIEKTLTDRAEIERMEVKNK